MELPPTGGDPNMRSGQRAPHLTMRKAHSFHYTESSKWNYLVTAKTDIYYIDTSNILFIMSGAFVGLDKVIKQRVAKGVSCLQLNSK
jgi:ATP-dependent Clp protease ATP-binding subunit ClpX